MRVLHFRRKFSPLSETFIYDLVSELERQTGDQHIATFSRENAVIRPFPRVHQVSKPSLWNPRRLWHRARAAFGAMPAFASTWPLLQRRLRSIVEEVRPDLIHAHFGPEGALIAPVAESAGIPFVTSFYGHDASRLLEDPVWRELLQRLVLQGDTIALSERMRARLIDMGADPERTHVVHLGKRLDRYLFFPPTRVRRFLSVGRMTGKKGHLDAVEAFASVVRDHPEIHLDIVGGGRRLSEVTALVARMGLRSHVTLHGALPHEHVQRLFGRADAFLLCSKQSPDGDREGTPTVLLEAQAAGLPCISTFHAGIPETIPLENQHLLAEEGDIAQIAARIRRLVSLSESEVRRIAQRGRAKVEREFDIVKESRRLQGIYVALDRARAPASATRRSRDER